MLDENFLGVEIGITYATPVMDVCPVHSKVVRVTASFVAGWATLWHLRSVLEANHVGWAREMRVLEF